ncbi:hypothetical protein G5B40_20755 [Pikeienuella piscinae]|uniref:Uncharacterized protein n=1 Tax=Pikeienuella piscinae TaxID=2748098 RepID=A0A7M3T6N5_9RHOB|nr:hypothetical protein [Pikeienuella piscinae]QIE57666.1 hypothetical protein G5B40_20755 [Pikeienuella piscinae]
MIEGGGGGFGRHPGKRIDLYDSAREGCSATPLAPLAEMAKRRLLADNAMLTQRSLAGLWSGVTEDPFAGAMLYASDNGDLAATEREAG